ncbi:hypothetical protein D3C72_2117280 [compost metagenome]
MGHLVNLRFHRRVQARMVVPVDGCPPGGHSVDQRFAGSQMQFTPVRRGDRINGQRPGHGGVGVPDMLLVEGEIVRGHNRLVNHFEKF